MTDEEAWGRKPEEQRPLPLRDHASQVFVARVGETQILTKGPVSLGPLFICICRCSSFTAAGGGGGSIEQGPQVRRHICVVICTSRLVFTQNT